MLNCIRSFHWCHRAQTVTAFSLLFFFNQNSRCASSSPVTSVTAAIHDNIRTNWTYLPQLYFPAPIVQHPNLSPKFPNVQLEQSWNLPWKSALWVLGSEPALPCCHFLRVNPGSVDQDAPKLHRSQWPACWRTVPSASWQCHCLTPGKQAQSSGKASRAGCFGREHYHRRIRLQGGHFEESSAKYSPVSVTQTS